MKALSIRQATHLMDYKVEIVFNDNKTNVIDFGTFLTTHNHPQYNKYKEIENFKTFSIENGNIVWGKDWDLIFPVYDLYKGKLE